MGLATALFLKSLSALLFIFGTVITAMAFMPISLGFLGKLENSAILPFSLIVVAFGGFGIINCHVAYISMFRPGRDSFKKLSLMYSIFVFFVVWQNTEDSLHYFHIPHFITLVLVIYLSCIFHRYFKTFILHLHSPQSTIG